MTYQLVCSLITVPEARLSGHCSWDGKPLQGRQRRWCSHQCEMAYWENHDWTLARNATLRRDGRKCVRCGSGASPEVNHKDPRLGRGYQAGCWHHLDGLETLCHACHVVETTRQGRERRGIPPEGRPVPEPRDRFPGARPIELPWEFRS